MEYNYFLLLQKRPLTVKLTRFIYESLLSKWFLFPAGLMYISRKPASLSSARGFILGNNIIRSILVTTDEYKMHETDADAILANYTILPGENRLKGLISRVKKPVILSLWPHIPYSKFFSIIKKIELSGASAFYAGRMLPVHILRKVCSECSVPVITATGNNQKVIAERISAGVYAIEINGRSISRNLIHKLKSKYADIPLIVYGGRSESLMNRCIDWGIDAITYKPCIPFEEKWAGF